MEVGMGAGGRETGKHGSRDGGWWEGDREHGSRDGGWWVGDKETWK